MIVCDSNKLRQELHRGKGLKEIAETLGISIHEASKARQIYAQDTYTPRVRLTQEQKAQMRGLIEADVTDSEIARTFGIHHSTVHGWRIRWGYKSSKYAALAEKSRKAREAFFAGLGKQPEVAPQKTKNVALGSGYFAKPVFDKPKTYNDYLKEQRDKVRPIFKSTYRPRYHLGADIIIPI
jgi:transposase-like protein